MKILLIEDHPDSRRSLCRLIERRGHTVTACASAEEAELEMTRESFPFLILDWMLPGKSGVDLCRDLRGRPNGDEMYILLVTARADPEDLEQALAAGANDYLTKPLDARRLNVRLSVAERHIRELEERNQNRRALQESARRMSDILEKTSDGFFAVDRDWKFTYLNAEAEEMLGAKRETLVGQNLWLKFPDLTGTVFEENFRKVMIDQIAIEFEALDAAEKSCFEVHSYPSSGGISVFFRDITERKRAEDERLTTSKLESLGTLAGGIAHDLNNILTVISGNIGLAQLEAPVQSGNLTSYLAKAGQAAQHAARLSSQLLTFSKGGAPLKKVASVADLLQHAAEFSLYGSKLRAAIEIEDHLGKAEIDVAQVEQVVNALMINAREAMPNGGRVDVSAENVKLSEHDGLPLPPGRYVKVAITDHGPGVPPDLIGKIFDPYFTTKTTASGLGLAISYSIIRKHGGYLHVEKNSPTGATFSFYLPATTGKILHDPLLPEEPAPDFSQQRILVMDDESAIRELTSQLLATMGYEVTAVPDGSEAVRIYERAARRGESFRAVILDATVRGGLGGVETIQRLRSIDPDVNAIICSGYSDEAALSEFLSYGFRGALPKPFTRRELADALEKALVERMPA
ncbi:MAG TPA: response regulator [Chthoniobacterales bacterium]|jgi:PAS domain S-box-containing protein|nr:response regulator [Chthoniobacterales bacterium]